MSINTNYLPKKALTHKVHNPSMDMLNETVSYLSKINKINESSINIAVKNRSNYIIKEKERLASIDNNCKILEKKTKKDLIYNELSSLFHRYKQIDDNSFSDSNPYSIYNSKNNILLNHHSSNEFAIKKDRSIKDNHITENLSMNSLNTMKSNIISKIKEMTINNNNKRFFNTEIENSKKADNEMEKIISTSKIITIFPMIKKNDLKLKSQVISLPRKNKDRTKHSIDRATMDFTSHMLKPKACNTVVKFHNFPQNFPFTKKDQYKKISLGEIFNVLKVYKPDFKF